MKNGYPRDMVGYGKHLPAVQWPGNARIAVQFVLNYEEGGEYCVLHGDSQSESYLSEIVGTTARSHARDLNIESIYEYGSRAGFWRIWRLFTQKKVPLTVFGVGMALQRNPEAAKAMAEAGWEVASHGYRWIDYHEVPEEIEREHIQNCVQIIEKLTGERPYGWYTGRISPNTRRLVVEAGGFLYDSDNYADDLPYWDNAYGKPLLIIPYALDTNDFRYAMPQGFNSGEQFFSYAKDAFDYLHAEGESRPRMLSVGLHCRLSGRPGRTKALAEFLDYVLSHENVWITRRIDIARYWHEKHPYQAIS